MSKKVIFGAHSRVGVGIALMITEAFGEEKFPIRVVVTNHAPRTLVFPEVRGLSLAHCGAATGASTEVEINSMDQLRRLGSSIVQVAELNGYAQFVTIELPVAEPEPVAKAKPKTKTKAGPDDEPALADA